MAAGPAHHIVIVGAGFGGLEVARYLAGTSVRITVIDGRNHHLFQPLLFQVATASLATSEVFLISVVTLCDGTLPCAWQAAAISSLARNTSG